MRVNVIGAGFSGLASAYYLNRAGFEVVVYDKEARAGGMIASKPGKLGLIESAANGMLYTEEVDELFKDLGLKVLGMRRESRSRFFKYGAIHRWPLSPMETITTVGQFFHWLFVKKLRGKSGPPKSKENLYEYLRVIFGDPFCKKILSPALQGIFATSIDRLSARLIYNSVFSNRRKPNRPRNHRHHGTVSTDVGLGGLTENMFLKLKERGVQFHLGKEVKEIVESDFTVVALPLNRASQLLKKYAPKFSTAADRVPMVALLSVTAFFEPNRKFKKGFGCLFPDGESPVALGVLFNENIFDGRSEKHSETWILGGLRAPEVCRLSDEEVTRVIEREHKALWGSESQILEIHVQRWPTALPLYGLELEELLELQWDIPENIRLCGNYLGGIGLSKILLRAKEIAEALQEQKK